MKRYPLVVLGAAGLAVFWVSAAMTQPAPKAAASKPAAPKSAAPKPAARQAAGASAYQAKGFTPGFDDLMTMLIQPRHIRLHYAGAAKNWEMAAAESRDLRQSFDRLSQAIANYEGNDVPQAVTGFMTPKLDAIDAAIAAADAARFDSAYKDLTDGCNGCHHYMEHPFLVIKVPNGAQDSAHPDQDFNPGAN